MKPLPLGMGSDHYRVYDPRHTHPCDLGTSHESPRAEDL